MSNKSLKIAAIQMTSTDNIEENLRTAERLTRGAASEGAQMVVLPEYFAIMAAREIDKFSYVEHHTKGTVQDLFSSLAEQLTIWIVVGSHPIESSDSERPFGRCYVYNDLGKLVAWYDKIHLFDVTVGDNQNNYCESRYTSAGQDVVCFDSPWGKVGLAICYDIRFPEMFRKLQELGCEILIIPAAFTYKTGAVHWEVLLKARAVENLCYVIASAQAGEHVNGRHTWGHSCIISPWGKMLAELPTGAGYAISELDRKKQLQLRKEFPVLNHKKI